MGKRLLQLMIAYARDRGVNRVRAQIAHSNAAARCIYAQFGFVEREDRECLAFYPEPLRRLIFAVTGYKRIVVERAKKGYVL